MLSASCHRLGRLFMLKQFLNKFKKKNSKLPCDDIISQGGNSLKEEIELDVINEKPRTECSSCWIDVKDLKKNRQQPIFLNSQTKKLISTQDGKIFLNDGETMELFCPDHFKSPYNHQKVIKLRCNNGKLTVEEHESDLGCFSCNTKVESSVQSTSINCSNSGAIIYKNGFNTHCGFIELMTHCHDPKTRVTHWVDYYLTPENRFCQSSTKDKFFPANYIEGQDVKQLYADQRQTIAKILQSNKLADKIISNKNNYFLDEGHLGPRSDFLLSSHQHATYNRINVMPQFKSFNGGNWNETENGVRKYVADKKIHARIRTGVYGTIEFKDATGISKPISLTMDGKFPVPKIFYKIIIPEGKEPLIVLVGVNNPHATLEDIEHEYTFCKTKIFKEQLKDEFDLDMNWSDNLKSGYMYACRYDDFNQFVPQEVITEV